MSETSRISDIPIRLNGEAFTKWSEETTVGWGSDAIVEQLSRLDLRYIALVPGSSYRGVHDSLVNLKGNAEPEMLVCLHEEHAVAIAHGYAKVTERPMAVALHANVGLMHATMAIYNAFCDRVPMVILGATGPLDSDKRRPWIDWIHTAQDQAALIRPFIKFDDQPHSVNAAVRSLVTAAATTIAKPSAPVYLCLDVHLQEDKLDPKTVNYPDTSRYLQVTPPGPSAESVKTILSILTSSSRPLFLFGRVNRSETSWNERIQLAELFSAKVLTDLKQACAFPTNHALHACPPSIFNSSQASEIIKFADVILSFDWVDLAGTLKAAHPSGEEPSGKIVHCSLDSSLHNGWSKDHFGHPPIDHPVYADPDVFLSALLSEAKAHQSAQNHTNHWPPTIDPTSSAPQPAPSSSSASSSSSSSDIFMPDLATALYASLAPERISLIRIPLGFPGTHLHASHPLSFLGQDGGAGVGSGPGQAVGAALALHSLSHNHTPPLIPVAILGDGDFLMASSALWTAARYRLRLLVIVANNASFFNDEVHQERVANVRGREVGNKWIGMRIDDPLPDLQRLARGYGCDVIGGGGSGEGGGTTAGGGDGGSGQVRKKGELSRVLEQAVQRVERDGKVVVVDVRVLPEGYSSALEKAK